MKTLSFLIASAALATTMAIAPPLQAQTVKKIMLTEVDPTVLPTAWRATNILGTMVFDDNGVEIGKVKDMLVAANGSVPFVIITNIPGHDDPARSVVVSASDLELVGNKLTMHGGSAAELLSLPIF
jgi:sporulation protein YlmC with PRC-barrel domain